MWPPRGAARMQVSEGTVRSRTDPHRAWAGLRALPVREQMVFLVL